MWTSRGEHSFRLPVNVCDASRSFGAMKRRDSIMVTSSAPKITVLMPVYNAERYLRTAVDSILGQTFSGFELLIVDDGSDDGSTAIVSSYTDKRIRLIRNECNLGLIATLNKGLQAARGQYVARMDADDISLPTRLERQIAYLERHREVGVVGSHFRQIDENGRILSTERRERKDFMVSFRMYMEAYNPFCHPAVMFRTKEIRDQGGYSPAFPSAEDGALWFQLNESGTRFATIPKVFLLYRIHCGQICQQDKHTQVMSFYRAYAESLSSLLGVSVLPEEAMRLHACRLDEEHIKGDADLEKLLHLKRQIALKFFETRRLGSIAVVACVANLWSSLAGLRKLDGVRAGYAGYLLRYCLGTLRHAMVTKGIATRFLSECLLLACLTIIIVKNGFKRALARLQASFVDPGSKHPVLSTEHDRA